MIRAPLLICPNSVAPIIASNVNTCFAPPVIYLVIRVFGGNFAISHRCACAVLQLPDCLFQPTSVSAPCPRPSVMLNTTGSSGGALRLLHAAPDRTSCITLHAPPTVLRYCIRRFCIYRKSYSCSALFCIFSANSFGNGSTNSPRIVPALLHYCILKTTYSTPTEI